MFIQFTLHEMKMRKRQNSATWILFGPDQRMALVTEDFKVVFYTLRNVLIRMAAVWRGKERWICAADTWRFVFLFGIAKHNLVVSLDWHKLPAFNFFNRVSFHIPCYMRITDKFWAWYGSSKCTNCSFAVASLNPQQRRWENLRSRTGCCLF